MITKIQELLEGGEIFGFVLMTNISVPIWNRSAQDPLMMEYVQRLTNIGQPRICGEHPAHPGCPRTMSARDQEGSLCVLH
jgi:hypothetical protein